MEEVCTTFVHGYEDDSYEVETDRLPALWQVTKETDTVHSFPFPRNVTDFQGYSDLIEGESPLTDTEDFTRRPRFGLTGSSVTDEYLYAGSWNGVYEISLSDFSLNRIISNRLMNDLHGIWTDGDHIITVLTGIDTVVISDTSGDIVDHFRINRDLSVTTDESIMETDWRFVSKQFRGATGYWHFNHVNKRGRKLWLTSRNGSCFVVVDLDTRETGLRLVNFSTPALVHDGVWHDDGNCYVTSVDGKLFKVAPAEKASFNPREEVEKIHLFNRDMVSEHIRLEETDFGREPNWCRGIDCKDDRMYVSVDGRYGTSSFGLIEVDWDGEIYRNTRLEWDDVGDASEIRYVTGFDVELID
jgi:hypothetical protein